MKKNLKRNIVMAAVLFFVCAAVYLNWSYSRRYGEADAAQTRAEDAHIAAAAERYTTYLRAHQSGKVLYLELGVGGNTPGIIKYPFLRYTYDNPQATYACLNFGEAVTAREIQDRSILIDADIDAVLSDLVETGE